MYAVNVRRSEVKKGNKNQKEKVKNVKNVKKKCGEIF